VQLLHSSVFIVRTYPP